MDDMIKMMSHIRPSATTRQIVRQTTFINHLINKYSTALPEIGRMTKGRVQLE